MKGEGNPRPSALYCWEEGRTLRPEFVLVSLRLFSASPLVLLEVGFLRTLVLFWLRRGPFISQKVFIKIVKRTDAQAEAG